MKHSNTAVKPKNHHRKYSLAGALLLCCASAWAASVTNQVKLLADDGVANDAFGYDVAVYGDTVIVGDTLVDGDTKGVDVGAAYGFTRSGTNWQQQARLMANDGSAKEEFGGKVAIWRDTAIVGNIRDDDEVKGEDSGSAYVFTRTGERWSQQAKLTAEDAQAGDALGWSIAVEGDMAVIGAPRDDDKGKDSGSVYVFKRTGSLWHQQAKLTASDGQAGDVFGISVALSGDSILVGADLNDEKAPNAGAAYVFTRVGKRWQQQAKLTAKDGGDTDLFGVRVALEGDTALISARRDDDDIMGVDAGSVYVFTRSGSKWQQQAKLTAPDGAADDRFGRNVALANNTALIGAMHKDDKGENSGAAYVFTRSGSQWRMQNKLTATDGAAGDRFGWSVALSDHHAVIAAKLDDDKGENSGSVYLFNVPQF